MTTIKSHTDLQQSKKLAEILPIESADMAYIKHSSSNSPTWEFNEDFPPMILGNVSINEMTVEALPCWSLAALLSHLPFPVLYMEMVAGMILWCCESHLLETDEVVKIEHYDNPIDACYEMILKLHELNLL